jgi:hypothetical protein
MLETALLANAAASLVADYVKNWRAKAAVRLQNSLRRSSGYSKRG